MLSSAASVVWIATSPVWLVSSGKQITVNNNQLLSDQNIQALLPLPYPQSLLRVDTGRLAEALAQYDPIESATVSRRLLPPGLQVNVRERIPVAITVPDTTQPIKTIPSNPVPFQEPGLIDAEGYWMPRNSFRELGAVDSSPAMTIKGMKPAQRSAWQTMYASIRRSPVKILAIDWTRPSNVVLYSELGKVYVGPYGKGFEAQLTALDQMRSIDRKVNPEQVAFIDLQNPERPVVEILQATSGTAGIP